MSFFQTDGLPQELMSSEGDGGEEVSGATTLMVTGLTSDQLAVTTATEEAVQQATIRAVLQAAAQMGEMRWQRSHREVLMFRS